MERFEQQQRVKKRHQRLKLLPCSPTHRLSRQAFRTSSQAGLPVNAVSRMMYLSTSAYRKAIPFVSAANPLHDAIGTVLGFLAPKSFKAESFEFA